MALGQGLRDEGGARASLARSVGWAARGLLDLAMPLSCAGCGREGAYLCDECDAEMPRLRRPFCVLCAAPGVPQLCENCRRRAPAFDAVRAPYEYRGAARRMVRDLKYRGVRVAARPMARLLARYLERSPHPADALIALPLHPRRERSRGYNQSALLASELGKLMDMPVDRAALRRVKHTKPQVAMESADARRRNIDGAFECAPAAIDSVAGRRYLLIDDVATTCETMSECAHALKRAGAAQVWALAFARQTPFADDAAASAGADAGDDSGGIGRMWA